MSTHVDDLKGAGEEPEVQLLFKHLRAKYGDLERTELPFEHCGMIHTQDGEDVVVSMDNYLLQLQPIPAMVSEASDPDGKTTPATHEMFRSLLGGLSWVALMRADIIVFVGYLQRHGNDSRHRHIVEINRVEMGKAQ